MRGNREGGGATGAPKGRSEAPRAMGELGTRFWGYKIKGYPLPKLRLPIWGLGWFRELHKMAKVESNYKLHGIVKFHYDTQLGINRFNLYSYYYATHSLRSFVS